MFWSKCLIGINFLSSSHEFYNERNTIITRIIYLFKFARIHKIWTTTNTCSVRENDRNNLSWKVKKEVMREEKRSRVKRQTVTCQSLCLWDNSVKSKLYFTLHCIFHPSHADTFFLFISHLYISETVCMFISTFVSHLIIPSVSPISFEPILLFYVHLSFTLCILYDHGRKAQLT